MTEKIIIAGAGGQGIMLLGKILAESAMRENKHVTWLPAYGAEVRGGTAYCMVVVSSQEIGSPYIEKADTLIIMNGPSGEKFSGRIRKKGLLFINSSLASSPHNKDVRLYEYPFTQIATRLGNIKVANMVALGYYLSKQKLVDHEAVLKTIEQVAPVGRRDLIEINHAAVRAGYAQQ